MSVQEWGALNYSVFWPHGVSPRHVLSLCNVFTDKCSSVSGVSREAGTDFFFSLRFSQQKLKAHTHTELHSAARESRRPPSPPPPTDRTHLWCCSFLFKFKTYLVHKSNSFTNQHQTVLLVQKSRQLVRDQRGRKRAWPHIIDSSFPAVYSLALLSQTCSISRAPCGGASINV